MALTLWRRQQNTKSDGKWHAEERLRCWLPDVPRELLHCKLWLHGLQTMSTGQQGTCRFHLPQQLHLRRWGAAQVEWNVDSLFNLTFCSLQHVPKAFCSVIKPKVVITFLHYLLKLGKNPIFPRTVSLLNGTSVSNVSISSRSPQHFLKWHLERITRNDTILILQ